MRKQADSRRTIATRVVAMVAAATLAANLVVVFDDALGTPGTVVVAAGSVGSAPEPSVSPTEFPLGHHVLDRLYDGYDAARQRIEEAERQRVAAAQEAERAAEQKVERAAAAQAEREAATSAESQHEGAPKSATTSPSSSAPTASQQRPTPSTAGDCDHVCRGERLAAQVSIPLPADWSYEFKPAHPSYAGMADGRRKVITLYVRDDVRDESLLWVLYHEVGHAYDFTYLDNADKQRWADSRGYSVEPWYPCNGCRDYAFPAGDWAESFAHCRSGIRGQFKSEKGGPPSSAQCSLMRELAP